MGNQKLEEVFNFQKDRKFNFFFTKRLLFLQPLFFVIIDTEVIMEKNYV